MRAMFFLYHYNDIDHTVPVVWKCLKAGDDVTLVLLNPDLDIEKDPRIQLIKDEANLYLFWIQDVLGPAGLAWSFRTEGPGLGPSIRRKVRSILRFGFRFQRRAGDFFRAQGTQIAIFEWGGPAVRGRIEFLRAARGLGVPTVCLPHGLNIYLNQDMNPERSINVRRGRQTFQPRNGYDAYVHQSLYHQGQDVELGLDPGICHVLGSARYSPEWQKVNQSLYPTYQPVEHEEDRLRVVFMLPHWTYNVDKGETLNLIENLAQDPTIHLIVKTHTRGSGGFPVGLYRQLKGLPGFQVETEASSVPLIEWSDAVVNFGSSIGLEALLQGTLLINPQYLHRNETIFDKSSACITTEEQEETLAALGAALNGTPPGTSADAKEEIFRRVVYGGREPHDVLGAYRELLSNLARNGG